MNLCENIIINQSLKKYILSDIDLFSTDLEKAIYIYIKMCKTFTYDESFFILGQNEEYQEVRKHKNISSVENISLENNKVVCYNFIVIYSIILSELGISNIIKYNTIEEYGRSHMYIIIDFNKTLIRIDPVTSIIDGDIYRAKLNKELKGIKLVDEDYELSLKLKNIIEKVYKLIEIKDISQLVNNNYNNLNLYKKIDLLVNEVNKINLEGIDAFSYLMDLSKTIFTSDELNNNFKIVLIRNNSFNSYKTSAIFVVNEESIYDDYYDTEYYLFNLNDNLTSIDSISLKEKFLNKEFEYLPNSNLRIPCLILKK